MPRLCLQGRRPIAAIAIALTLFSQPFGSQAVACKFNVVTSANPVPNGDDLFGVSATAARDAWAVGFFINAAGTAYDTLAEHLNGSALSIVTSPNVNAFNDQLASIVWNSANDIWAGGAYSPSSSQLDIHDSLTEQWNGSAWSIISSPNCGTSSNNINAMAAISPTKMYGAGDFYTGTQFDTLGETWNETSWAIKPTPNFGTSATEIFGMAGSRLSGALAVGQFVSGGPSRTFAMMFTSTGWKIAPSANVGAHDNFFNGAGAIPGTDDAWGVGGTEIPTAPGTRRSSSSSATDSAGSHFRRPLF